MFNLTNKAKDHFLNFFKSLNTKTLIVPVCCITLNTAPMIKTKKISAAAWFIPFGIEENNPSKLVGLASPSTSAPSIKPIKE